MSATNIIRRYFGGQVLYWCGWGWSNVAANAERFADLCDAHVAARTVPEGEVSAMVLGPNLSRVFNVVGAR